MPTEKHEEMQLLIDKSLGGEMAREENDFLIAHLNSCPECRKYQASAGRIVAALEGFTFEVTPDLNAKVQRSVEELVGELQAARQERRQMRMASFFAFLLSFLGSSVVWPAAGFLAARFSIAPDAMQLTLLVLWVGPSLFSALLLPVVSGWLEGHEVQKGWTS